LNRCASWKWSRRWTSFRRSYPAGCAAASRSRARLWIVHLILLILRLRDLLKVTSLLATHRLQDAFGLANYRFDAGTGRAVAVAQNGVRAGVAPTKLLVLRDGVVYFEGDTRKFQESQDAYLKEFLVSAES
jgi:hypothetical protein